MWRSLGDASVTPLSTCRTFPSGSASQLVLQERAQAECFVRELLFFQGECSQYLRSVPGLAFRLLKRSTGSCHS
jgi:hypothetical protein